jgi:hypothetical protein
MIFNEKWSLLAKILRGYKNLNQYKNRFDDDKKNKKRTASRNNALPHMQPQKPSHKSPTRLHVGSATVLGKIAEQK